MSDFVSSTSVTPLSIASPKRLRVVSCLAAAVYLIGTSAFLVTHGSWPTPDFLLPPLILVAVINGRGWQFVLDWAPFLLLILAYEGFRGIADNLNNRVHFVALIDADKWLLGNGATAPNYLQEHFFREDRVAWYDWVASGLHMAHFVLPVAFGFGLWLSDRATFWRYAVAVLGLFFSGFATYILYPAAPPWMAADLGLIPHVERILIHTLVHLPQTRGISIAYEYFSPNAVAAMPSLHAALPLLIVLIAIDLFGRRALPALLYPIAGGFAWMYLGEHYLIDLLAGWIYALAAFVVFWRLAPRLWRKTIAALPALRGVDPWSRAPAWPLAAASLCFIVAVWVNPLLQAPISPSRGALTPDAGIRLGVEQAASLADLQPVDCAAGRSGSILIDRSLDRLVPDYAGYIQGLRSATCLSITAAPGIEALNHGELLRIGIDEASVAPLRLDLPDSPFATFVFVGHPGDELQAMGIDPTDVLAVVVRVSPTDDEAAIVRIVAEIAQFAFTIGDSPLTGSDNCGGECPPPSAADHNPAYSSETAAAAATPDSEETPTPTRTPEPSETPAPTPTVTVTPVATEESEPDMVIPPTTVPDRPLDGD